MGDQKPILLLSEIIQRSETRQKTSSSEPLNVNHLLEASRDVLGMQIDLESHHHAFFYQCILNMHNDPEPNCA